jgi:hypothetical protein
MTRQGQLGSGREKWEDEFKLTVNNRKKKHG